MFQGDCKTFFPLLLVRPSVVGAPALFSAVMRFSSMPAQAAAESIYRANSAVLDHNFLSVFNSAASHLPFNTSTMQAIATRSAVAAPVARVSKTASTSSAMRV